MKVPKGKTFFIGGKKFKTGDELPDNISERLEKSKVSKPNSGFVPSDKKDKDK